MAKTQKIKGYIKTGIIIAFIYLLFVLYLLFVSDRIEKLDNKSYDDPIQNSLKIGE